MLGKDIYREILSKLEDEDLMKACCSNRYFHETICDDGFFHTRLIQKYPDTLKIKPKNIKYKTWLLRVRFWIRELKENFNYDYTEGNPAIQLQIFRHNYGENENLVISSQNGELSLVKYFLSQGADFRKNEHKAFRDACLFGHLSVVKYLLELGSDIHAYDECALTWASVEGYLDIVKYLVEKGANIHANYDYALMLAIEYGHLEVVKILVYQGMKLDIALKRAYGYNQLEIVRYLESLQ